MSGSTTTTSNSNSSAVAAVADVPPNQTIYINNLNEKIKKEELKKSLHERCSQYGSILDIVALKTLKMRGQAFVVFRDISAASDALRELNGSPFFGKPMKVHYAKSKSDAIAKLDNTYIEKERKPRPEKRKAEDHVEKKKPKRQETHNAGMSGMISGQSMGLPGPFTGVIPPNNILFVQNLPEECTPLMLSMLFQQFPGFKEARLVPGKPGIAFVEFETDMMAGVAMNALNNFKITHQNLMQISYAKKSI